MSPVADVIASQLGGNRFWAMTGARGTYDDRRLCLQLPRAAKNRIKYIRITLEPNDTYSVLFQATMGKWEVRRVAEFELVHGDGLKSLVEAQTGLALSL